MNYLSEVPEGQAIICSNGVYRQVRIAVRDRRVYARYGAGYVRLSQGGATSHPKVRWYEIDPGDGVIREEKGAVFFEGRLKSVS